MHILSLALALERVQHVQEHFALRLVIRNSVRVAFNPQTIIMSTTNAITPSPIYVQYVPPTTLSNRPGNMLLRGVKWV